MCPITLPLMLMCPIAHVLYCPCTPLPYPHVDLEGEHATLPICPITPVPMSNGAHRWWGSKMSNDVKLSKRCLLLKIKYLDYGKFTKNKLTWWGSHILTSILISHMTVTKNPQSVHRKYFWAILVTFIFDIRLDINICKPHYVNLFFVNLLYSPEIWLFWHLSTWHLFDNLTSFWHFDIFLNLYHLSPSQGYFIEWINTW